ncbi:MAG TPA: aldo/keto reductase [Candidatus Polarisedimenticolaceae bacterium]|nr:aldo/keto reductase [Candidatus Polarisedimenticolaceae bacterium]
MEYRLLGRTGVRVSRIALGCGGFGGVGSAPEFFGRGESEAEAFALLDRARELGITLLDTADAYGGGRSETTIGKWLAAQVPAVRERIVVTTKVFHSVVGDPSDRGLAGARIVRQIEGSLRRLGLERVPLYMIHEPDPATPLAETLDTLDTLKRQGKVGAVGACNIEASGLEQAERILPGFDWVQNSYSLLDRSAERDVLPACARIGLGFTPFSPLAGGWLTGKYTRPGDWPAGSRMTLRPEAYRRFENERTLRALARFAEAAHARGTDMAALAIAWLLAQPQVDAVIVGPRRPEQLEPARRALELTLTPAECTALAALFD